MAKILLEMKNITKTFPGVKALDNVNLKVEEGEIHKIQMRRAKKAEAKAVGTDKGKEE